MKKILLINPPLEKWHNYENVFYPPLGLVYLASFVEMNGFKAEVLDMATYPMRPAELLAQISRIKPDIIGISTFTINSELSIKMCKFIKENMPTIPIVMGGAHATFMYRDILQHDEIDYVIRHEGEATLVELLVHFEQPDLISLKDIDGLVYKENGEIIVNPPREFIQDLDLLPLANRSLLDIKKYSKAISIISARGCPGKCIYCAAAAMAGHKYRIRKAENVGLEMFALANEYGLRKFYIVDDTFTAVPKRAKEFCYWLINNKVNVEWQGCSRVDVMTVEMLKLLKEAGCTGIHYGIESGSQEVLDGIQKKIDLKKAKEIIAETDRLGMIPVLSFMYGHYNDTIDTMIETKNMLLEMYEKHRAEIQIGINTPFPGTYQWENLKKLGLRWKKDIKFSSFTLFDAVAYGKNFTLEDLKDFQYQSKEALMVRKRLNDNLLKCKGGIE